MEWFKKILVTFNGIIFDNKRVRQAKVVYVDACLTGVSAVWDDRVYAAPLIDVFNGRGHSTF